MDVNPSTSNHDRPPSIIRSISSAPTTPTNSNRFCKDKEKKARISSYETNIINKMILDVRRSIIQSNPLKTSPKKTSTTEVENLQNENERKDASSISFYYDRRNKRILYRHLDNSTASINRRRTKGKCHIQNLFKTTSAQTFGSFVKL